MLERRNTLSGLRYADDPAVLGWELGNELYDPRCVRRRRVPARARRTPFANLTCPAQRARRFEGYRTPPPAEWTEDVAAHIKELAQQLVIDGAQFSPTSLQLRNVDIVGRTYYNLPSTALEADLALTAAWNSAIVAGNSPQLTPLAKSFIVKEFGLVSAQEAVIETRSNT